MFLKAGLSFNLNIAVIVNSFFSAASFVREVNILSQSQGDVGVIILHLPVRNLKKV